MTNLRRSMRISDLHQRGHAGRAACWMALRAGGSAPNITAFVLRESVALVSGQCGVPQWPGTTKLSRGFGQQRGHAGRPVFDRAALRAVGQSTQHHRFRFASAVVSVSARGAGAPRIGAGEVHRQCFASVDQCAGAQIWPRLACASCWISHRLRLGLDAVVFVAVVAHARYGHPLRFYITPHCPQCPTVAALKLRLVPVTASRPSGEGNRRYAKWPSLESVAQPSALPGR